MPNSLKSKAVNGIIWSAIERFSVQGIQFVLSIIIARFVAPAEYGLIAMLAIFLSIAQTFIDSGFSNALIQKKDRSEIDFSTVFYFNIVISCTIYLLLYVCAPYVAVFYHEQQLIPTTRWLGLGVVITAFSIVQRAKLTILLNFKLQAKASLIGVIVSGIIGIFLAYYGAGVWALIVQSLMNNVLNTLFLWLFAKWKPAWVFSWQSFRGLFAFGSKLLLSGLLHTIYINLYSLVIGKRYSAADVGYYNRAYSFAQFPSVSISGVLTRAMYPVQCELQDDDERLRASFIRYLRISCFLIFPLMVGVAVLAKPLVLILLTQKWMMAAPLLSILCFAYIWYPVAAINNYLLNAKGRSDYFFRAEVIKKGIAILILLITMPLGVVVLCWGLVIYYLIDICISIFYVRKLIGIGYLLQFQHILPFFALSLTMGGVVYILTFFMVNIYWQLFAGIAVGILVYCCLNYLFRVKDFLLLMDLFRSKFYSRS